MAQYNQRNPAVKRLMKEAQELREPTEDYFAQPLEDNLFEWHFTVRGPPDSDFEGGFYHGRILLPSEYPMKPPNIIIMTPNGRFEVNKKICLSISGHHPETWQPSWSLRTAMLALIGFMPTEGQGAIGSLDCPADERKKMARKSGLFKCAQCGLTKGLLKDQQTPGHSNANEEARQLASQMSFTSEGDKKSETEESTPVVQAEVSQPEDHLQTSGEPEVSPELRLRLNPVQVETSVPPTGAANPTSRIENPDVPAVQGLVAPTTEVIRFDARMIINLLMGFCGAGFVYLVYRRLIFMGEDTL